VEESWLLEIKRCYCAFRSTGYLAWVILAFQSYVYWRKARRIKLIGLPWRQGHLSIGLRNRTFQESLINSMKEPARPGPWFSNPSNFRWDCEGISRQHNKARLDTHLAPTKQVDLSGDAQGCCLFHMSDTGGCSSIVLLLWTASPQPMVNSPKE
jgi:hypothetical protein